MSIVWKDIPNYPLYKINNLGQIYCISHYSTVTDWGHKVRHFYKGHYMKYGKTVWGYLTVYLYNLKGRKSFRVHRLEANLFVPNPHHYTCINHKDENKHNNKASNLEWCTVKYNDNYGTRSCRIAKHEGHSIILQDIKLGKKYRFQSLSASARFIKNIRHYRGSTLTIVKELSSILHKSKSPSHYSCHGFKILSTI